MFKRVLLLALCFLSISPSRASKFFIDDIIDNVKEQIDRKFTPFFIRLKDVSTSPRTVSHSTRQLRLKLFYKKDLVRKMRNLDQSELEETFNDVLDLDSETGDGSYGLNEAVFFSLENIRVKSSDPSYFEAHFLSNEIVLDQAQKLTASFDVDSFMDSFSINRDTKDRTQEDILKIKAILIEITKEFSFEANPEQYDADKDFFNPQTLITSFPKDNLISELTSIDFQAYKNGRLKEALVKLGKRKFLMKPESNSDLANLLTEGDDNYQLNIPFRLDLTNSLKAPFFKSGRKFKLLLPIQVDGETNDGLELRIKIFSKLKIQVN